MWHFAILPLGSSAIVHWSITKWYSLIPRKPFDLESPNSTRTSTPTCSTSAPDMTSPVVSGPNLSGDNRRNCRLRRRRVEFLEKGLREDHEILHAYRGQSVSQICRMYDFAICFRSAAKYVCSIVFCNRLQAASDILFDSFVRLAVLDKCLNLVIWLKPLSRNSTQGRRRRHFDRLSELPQMPTGSSWWCHIRSDCRAGRMNVRANFSDSRLNGDRTIRLFVRPDPIPALLRGI